MAENTGQVLVQGTAVSIAGQGLLFLGEPGSGKSSLALSLIDRGAQLIGDDGVAISNDEGTLAASPPPNIAGMLEIRNVGIVELPVTSAPLSLILQLCDDAPRFVDRAERHEIAGAAVPLLKFRAGDAVQALRAEMALKLYGLPRTGK
ncbi:MAG TPA: serine kinase [Erythrobacter sp.]|nr:serine kinase [Erythrobacter sp.]